MLSYQIHSESVEKMLNKMRTELPEKIVEAVDTDIEAGVASAKYLVPKDTRKLKNSIAKEGATKKEGNVVRGSYKAIATNKKGHNYGFYQETGWTDSKGRFHEGKFYMKKSKDKAEKVFKKSCNQLLGRFTR